MCLDSDDATLTPDGLPRREAMAPTVASVTMAASGAEAATLARVSERAVDIETADGACDAILLHAGKQPSPAVIWYPDGFGLRQAHIDMGKRLAAEGYVVLVINPFYRARRAPVHPPGFDFNNPADREQGMKLIAMLDHDAVLRDASSFVAFLDAQPEVDPKAKIGAVGYCMGGAMTVRAQFAASDRVQASASFHGGSLVTEDPNSPHKLVARTKGAYHIAIGIDDDEKQPEAKTLMAKALDDAKRPYTQEVYPGAKHGWMVPDRPIYDHAQAERGWAAMLRLYKQALV
jgi:carboxymethylenebutenolidase